ncbi:MAG: DUF1549 domain-containing protein [Acidobacteria bacterium]|nr:DUF1549 domain-containing protein [Acidobacteriota bacterium]
MSSLGEDAARAAAGGRRDPDQDARLQGLWCKSAGWTRIEEWPVLLVESGFAWPAGGAAGAQPSWWSFRKVERAAVPNNAATHPVDAFIAAKLAEKKLTAAPLADKRTLVRRAYFDLHGLPAPVDEIERFETDPAPDAWSKLVDRLLESPRYAERWGRHWLDVVRYADTGGFETDIYFPNAWRYRD